MTRRYALFCVTVASLTLLPAAAMTMQNVEPGFTSLFNGKDLTGWVYGARGCAENKSGKGYQIENGIIYSTKEDGGNLYTEKEYADFVLRFDFKLTENANNGIGIRAPLEGDAAYVGMEIQVLDDGGSQYTQPAAVAVPRLDLRHGSRRSADSRSRSASGTRRRSPPRAGRSRSSSMARRSWTRTWTT